MALLPNPSLIPHPIKPILGDSARAPRGFSGRLGTVSVAARNHRWWSGGPTAECKGRWGQGAAGRPGGGTPSLFGLLQERPWPRGPGGGSGRSSAPEQLARAAFPGAHVDGLERRIDGLEAALPPLTEFILPGPFPPAPTPRPHSPPLAHLALLCLSCSSHALRRLGHGQGPCTPYTEFCPTCQGSSLHHSASHGTIR